MNQLEITGISSDAEFEINRSMPGFSNDFNEFVIAHNIDVSQLQLIKRIELIEAYLYSRPDSLKADFFPVNHQFSGGVYAREFFLPKGYMVVGKVHKGDHFLACTIGDCTMTTQYGSQRVTAHYLEQAKSGTKRIVFAHEDTVLVTFHKTDLDGSNIEAVENEIAENSDITWIEDAKNAKKHLEAGVVL